MDHTDIRTKCAQADLTFARRNGSLIIGQTTQGTVELSYDRAARQYSLVRQGDPTRKPETLAAGKPAHVVPVLAGLYVVTEDIAEFFANTTA